MITSGTAANIIYKDCKTFSNIKPYHKGTEPTGDVITERIVIIPKSPVTEKIWRKCFVEVNICVPYLNGKKDKVRTDTLEELAFGFFNHKTGVLDGTRYRYSSDVHTEEDTELKCYYVNVKILFEILNTQL